MKTFNEFITEAKTVKVPVFKTEKDFKKFIHSLPGAAKVAGNVVNPSTGELIMSKGEMKKKVFKQQATSMRKWGSFEDVYVIKPAMLSKVVGMSTQELADADIEDSRVPEFVQRKDGFMIDSDDLDEIKWEIEDNLPNNVKVSSFDTKGKKAFVNYELGE